MIGPGNSHHSLDQLDAKVKPITSGSPAFSRALGNLVVFILSFNWLLKVFSFLLIGHRDYSIEKRSTNIRNRDDYDVGSLSCGNI